MKEFDKDIRIAELERKVERLEDLLKKREELFDMAMMVGGGKGCCG